MSWKRGLHHGQNKLNRTSIQGGGRATHGPVRDVPKPVTFETLQLRPVGTL